MNFISGYDSILSFLCVKRNQFGIYMSAQSTGHDWNEVHEAVPFLEEEQLISFWQSGEAYLFFDTRQEMQDHFDQIVGEDSDKDIDVRVFAVSCSPTGNLLGENT